MSRILVQRYMFRTSCKFTWLNVHGHTLVQCMLLLNFNFSVFILGSPFTDQNFLDFVCFWKKIAKSYVVVLPGVAPTPPPQPWSVPIKNYLWIKKVFIKCLQKYFKAVLLQKYFKAVLLHNDDNSNNNDKQFMIVSQDSFRHHAK